MNQFTEEQATQQSETGLRAFLLPALASWLPWLALVLPLLFTYIDWRLVAAQVAKAGNLHSLPVVIDGVVLSVLLFVLAWFSTAWRLKSFQELQQVKDELEQTEERYRSVVNDVQEVIFQLDPQGAWTFLNSAWQTLAGHTVEETLGKGFLAYFHPDDREQCQTALNVIAQGGGEHCERTARLVSKDGQYRWVRINIRRSQSGQDVDYWVAGTIFDISARVRAEKALRETQQRYALALEAASDGMWFHDMVNDQVSFSNHWKEALGYSDDEMQNNVETLLKLMHPGDIGRYKKALQAHLERRVPLSLEVRLRPKEGDYCWFNLRTQAAWDDHGVALHMAGAATDISARKAAESETKRLSEQQSLLVIDLKQQKEELSKLREMADLIQSCMTLHEAYRIVGSFAQSLFSAESGAVYMLNASRNLAEATTSWGKIPSDEEVFQPEDCWALRRTKVNLVDTQQSTLQCAHVHDKIQGGYLCLPLSAQGETFGTLHLRDTAVTGAQRLSNRSSLIELFAEQVALALGNLKLRETLRLQSIRDPLTGLFNRRYLEETLAREERRAVRAQTSIGIIVFDVDHFKRFNDSYGHDAGDAVLRALGSLLQTHVRDGDIACRYGGEEFVIALPGASLAITTERAEALRKLTEKLPALLSGRSPGEITISLGAAAYPDHGMTWQEAIGAADKALYKAKHEGRNRVVVAEVP
ncbi:MAG: diguanylate cyclase [Burkholderiales bacterium]